MGDVALMFSGGLDTTVAALELRERFDRVHLLTVVQGFCLYTHRPSRTALEIQKAFGKERFPHRVLDGRELFRIMREDFEKYYRKYRSPLLVDLGCRLTMEALTVLYCKQHGISHSADGNSLAQDQIFIQQAEYLQAVREYFGRHGVEHMNPVLAYETREQRMDKLAQYGVNRGSDLLNSIGISSHFFKQAFCFGAVPCFFFTSWLRDLPVIRDVVKEYGLPIESALEFRKNREKIADAYIAEHIEKNIEL
jgi:hypothetical protein